MRRRGSIAWVVALAICLLGGCGEAGTQRPAHAAPETTADGWSTGDPSQYGLRMEWVAAARERIRSGSYVNIHSLLIVKDGTLVVEEYFPGTADNGSYVTYDRDKLHTLRSVSKSVTATLIGIAIDKGLIKDVDQPVATLLPEYADIFADPGKRAIRLRHLLSMTAGLQWDEWSLPYSDSRNDSNIMNRSDDPIRLVLGRPLVSEPGQTFVYNSGLSETLGVILQRASGLAPDVFAERTLFSSLGIADYKWSRYPNGSVKTHGGLSLRPRDMAKVGLLYLDGGSWAGQRVVAAEWVAECTKPQAPPFDHGYERGYGYQWWRDQFSPLMRGVVNGYSARGRGGQFIFVVPKHATVVVFTGWNDNTLERQALEIMTRFVLPAVD